MAPKMPVIWAFQSVTDKDFVKGIKVYYKGNGMLKMKS